MKKILSLILILTFAFMTTMSLIPTVGAVGDNDGTEISQEVTAETTDNASGSKALAAGIAIGLAAAFGALAMGISIAKTSDAIARQPEAAGQVRSSMMLGPVFIETAIIYALIIAILIIFVL